MKKIKVVITLLGEQKITNKQKAKLGIMPICGKSYLLNEDQGKELITRKFGVKCESLSPQQIKDAKALAAKEAEEEENK